MEKASQLVMNMKRVPRIKFPLRQPQPSSSDTVGIQFLSGSPSKKTEPLAGDDGSAAGFIFYSGSKAPLIPLGGKASLQPKRTPVSNEEMEAILLGGCF